MTKDIRETAIFNVLAVAVFVLAVLVALSTTYSPNNEIWWWDVAEHILGGFIAGLICSFFILGFSKIDTKNFLITYLLIIGMVALIGTAWEFHEFLLDQTVVKMYSLPKTQPDATDTMKDEANNLLGGTLAILLYWNTRNRRKLLG
ncbi:MAG: hypothetical protein WC797_00480 [Candidatus Paceibacterota bacterium]|jgi:hypothetical protein